jgi:hypothetical protein
MRLRLRSRLRRRNRRAKRLIWKDRFEGQLFGIEQPLRVGSRDSNRKAPAKAVAAAPERPASGNQRERIERKAARRRCPKALAPILDNIRKYAVPAPIAARKCKMTAARTATAREIPIEIISLIFAIAVVLFLHSEIANFSFSRY